MRVALGCAMRDMEAHLPTWYHQVRTLEQLLAGQGAEFRVIVAENDSVDLTRRSLLDNLVKFWPGSDLIEVHDECPHWPSEDIAERWRHIAYVCNHVLDAVTEDDDIFLYVESDLSWDPKDMVEMIALTAEQGAITAPCYYRQRDGRYYDVWGSRADGAQFTPLPNYHPRFERGALLDMDTCASVLCVSGDLARKTRFSPEDCFRGWSRDVKAENGSLLMATNLAVVHP